MSVLHPKRTNEPRTAINALAQRWSCRRRPRRLARNTMMPDDIIRDPSTGHQIAYADASGKVRDVNTNEIVAFIVDGNLYSTNGGFLGRVESSDNVQSGTAPRTFHEVTKAKKEVSGTVTARDFDGQTSSDIQPEGRPGCDAGGHYRHESEWQLTRLVKKVYFPHQLGTDGAFSILPSARP